MADPKPYAYDVNRVTISGDCFNGAEVWTTGFFLGHIDGDADDPDGLAEEIAAYWSAFFTTANSTISPYYRSLQCKVSHIGANGVTDGNLTDYYDWVTPPVGQGAASALPPQTSLVCTLTSSITRGAGAKGRMYLPGVNGAVQNTGKVIGTTPTNASLNLKTMFDAINADVDIPGQVILASHGPMQKTLPGPEISYPDPLNVLVTGLRIGDVYDTQRRRRNGLTEFYTSRALA